MLAELIKTRFNLTLEPELTAISGGITNRNYLVSLDGKPCWVLRQFGIGTEELGIVRGTEQAYAERASSLGLGPSVIACWHDKGIMLSTFCEGACLTPETAVMPTTLDSIVTSLRSLHQSGKLSGRFVPGEVVNDYVLKSVRHGVKLPEPLYKAVSLLSSIEEALAPRREKFGFVPCHNDLLPGNFILQPDGKVMLLDWDYAGMGDLFFDLGNLAVNLEFPEHECEKLIALYFDEVRPDDLAHLHLMRLASDMRESMWGFLQSGISELDQDYTGYALKHLNRFLRNASDPRVDIWLAQVSVTS